MFPADQTAPGAARCARNRLSLGASRMSPLSPYARPAPRAYEPLPASPDLAPLLETFPPAPAPSESEQLPLHDPAMQHALDELFSDINGPPTPVDEGDGPLPSFLQFFLDAPNKELMATSPRAVNRKVVSLTSGGYKAVEIGIDVLEIQPYSLLTGTHQNNPVWIRLTAEELLLLQQDSIFDRIMSGFADPHERVPFNIGGLEVSWLSVGPIYLCLKRSQEEKKLLYTQGTVSTWKGLRPALSLVLDECRELVSHVRALLEDMTARVLEELRSRDSLPQTVSGQKDLVRDLLHFKTLPYPFNNQWGALLPVNYNVLWHELKDSHFGLLFDRIKAEF